ncbi:hypothetical protein DYB28_004432, partial [Aphanomyces astaci]
EDPAVAALIKTLDFPYEGKLIPTSTKAVVVARLKQLSMDNTLLRTRDRMTGWQARYTAILTYEAAEDIDYFHPKAVIQALMLGIKPNGA